ncbi:hypothetical protein HNQ08_002489 [Deinococcus humi]|uniref:Uncharacterized protein n=1 Tax=Deinococcus humi TaxID=662880 RepID=A0A7W8NEI9_9DEIO|nr:hypothetical protein [Deinococcus humi]
MPAPFLLALLRAPALAATTWRPPALHESHPDFPGVTSC